MLTATVFEGAEAPVPTQVSAARAAQAQSAEMAEEARKQSAELQRQLQQQTVDGAAVTERADALAKVGPVLRSAGVWHNILVC